MSATRRSLYVTSIRLFTIVAALLLGASFVSHGLEPARTPAAWAFGSGLFLLVVRVMLENMAAHELSRRDAARTEWFPEESTGFDEVKQVD